MNLMKVNPQISPKNSKSQTWIHVFPKDEFWHSTKSCTFMAANESVMHTFVHSKNLYGSYSSDDRGCHWKCESMRRNANKNNLKCIRFPEQMNFETNSPVQWDSDLPASATCITQTSDLWQLHHSMHFTNPNISIISKNPRIVLAS